MQLISLSPQIKTERAKYLHMRKFFKDLLQQNVGEDLKNVQPS